MQKLLSENSQRSPLASINGCEPSPQAALAYEREEGRRAQERAREEAARQKERERRQQAVDKAQAASESSPATTLRPMPSVAPVRRKRERRRRQRGAVRQLQANAS
ncbi:hypothetical protein BEL01nite_83840 [Bradyrhizobium elkanii]|nr:hypothetical protein BEL01nite_83840 [Bradyrhizobium elkanii]